ncbi:cob(I)yrinic acid a,c-diamide adenosyltransferase [Patescibacteria group bacterium]|nr:cob(I)yrinic acid a,c-diamide adenosyltransferase [Patescibacteria group bacterium]
MGFFYTGKGDKGTSQIGKKKVPKDSPVIAALGDLDELNSLIGLVRSDFKNKKLSQKLQNVQETLFIIQARVAWIMFSEYEAKQLTGKKVTELEREIDAIEEKIKPERGFIISGSDPMSAQLDYIRAVSRRVELSINVLHKKYELPQEILSYMNRLSSYFYALARNEIYEKNIKEPKPTYE